MVTHHCTTNNTTVITCSHSTTVRWQQVKGKGRQWEGAHHQCEGRVGVGKGRKWQWEWGRVWWGKGRVGCVVGVGVGGGSLWWWGGVGWGWGMVCVCGGGGNKQYRYNVCLHQSHNQKWDPPNHQPTVQNETNEIKCEPGAVECH